MSDNNNDESKIFLSPNNSSNDRQQQQQQQQQRNDDINTQQRTNVIRSYGATSNDVDISERASLLSSTDGMHLHKYQLHYN